MRLWVHVIWLKTNSGTTLATAGPKEDRKLEAFINQWGEYPAAYAWDLYVNSDPRAYNLAAVKHVDKFTTKTGNTVAREVEDQGAITRFPLSAFLATADGYAIQAKMHEEALLELRKEFPKTEWLKHIPAELGGHEFGNRWLRVNEAIRKRMNSLNNKWGAANEPAEELS